MDILHGFMTNEERPYTNKIEAESKKSWTDGRRGGSDWRNWMYQFVRGSIQRGVEERVPWLDGTANNDGTAVAHVLYRLHKINLIHNTFQDTDGIMARYRAYNIILHRAHILSIHLIALIYMYYVRLHNVCSIFVRLRI